jgi:hypothetical protein
MLFDFLTFFSYYMLIGGLVIVLFAIKYRSNRTEINIFFLALLFRMLCTFYYYVFAQSNPADALGYFLYAQQMGFPNAISQFFRTGVGFIDSIAALFFPLVSFFDNQYLMLFAPFSILGFAGSLLFYRTLQVVAPIRKKIELYAVCFFLPNMVFWTSNLGKDSVMYFGIVLIMFGFLAKLKSPRNMIAICIGGFLVYSVRPHMFMFMTAGFLMGLIFERRKLSFRTIAVFVLVFAALLFTQEKILDYTGVHVESEEEKPASISSYYEAGVSRIEASSQTMNIGGAAMGDTPRKFSILYFPYYLVTFLASPFLWQARKPIQFFSALETIIYQIMLVYLCIRWKDVAKIRFIRFKYSWLMYLILSSIIEGAAQTNFGLIVRQRCMVLPVIFLLFTGVRYYLSVNKPQKAVVRPAGIISAKAPAYAPKIKA